MSSKVDLAAFLHPAAAEDQEIVISTRFRGEDGAPAPFRIRAVTQAENEELIRLSTRRRKVNGRTEEDKVAYSRRMVVAATVRPDFRQEELCRAYGVMDPLEAPGKMLLTGEYTKLSSAIMELSGLTDDLEETAKN